MISEIKISFSNILNQKQFSIYILTWLMLGLLVIGCKKKDDNLFPLVSAIAIKQKEGSGNSIPGLSASSTATLICDTDTNYQPPSISMTANGSLVACLSRDSQNVTPELHFVDLDGTVASSVNLLTSNAGQRMQLFVNNYDGKYQVTYEYNCSDTGSWAVGWGWTCVNFREYSLLGALVGTELKYGVTGLNRDPALAYNGVSFGTAFVGYDKLYFREIDESRNLVGTNINLGQDPDVGDGRFNNHVDLAYDDANNEYGIFTVFSKLTATAYTKLYFSRVSSAGASQVGLTEISANALGYTAAARIKAHYQNGNYFVTYYDKNSATLRFIKVNRSGVEQCSTDASTTASYFYPSTLQIDGYFYIVDGNTVKVFDEECSEVVERGGTLGDGQAMNSPMLGFDPASGNMGVVYLDASNKVYYQRLAGR